jgi:hypothetical protein
VSEREDTTPGSPIGRPYARESGVTASGGATSPDYGSPASTAPEYSTRPVAYRRPDILAGLLLVLAGVAAAISLVLPWVKGSKATGLDLVREGLRSFSLVVGGFWQPLAIVLGGGVLFLIGLLVLLPARSHRFFGLLALLVTLVVAAGLLVPLAQARWRLDVFDTGFWFGLAVGGLGLLGSLKALLSRRKYASR